MAGVNVAVPECFLVVFATRWRSEDEGDEVFHLLSSSQISSAPGLARKGFHLSEALQRDADGSGGPARSRSPFVTSVATLC